jgi:hypothetical protein
MLTTFTGAGVVFALGVSQQMQSSLVAALTALAAALAADAVVGDVQVAAGFDPTATDLSSVGRGLLMRHDTLGSDRLSGYALQAGFGFVQNRVGASGGPAVYAAAYTSAGPPPTLTGDGELVLDALTQLSLRPGLALTGSFDWCLLPCCGAAATLSTAMLAAPSATPGAVDKILHGTSTGVVTVDAAFSLDDAAEPYQFVIVPASLPEGVQPRLTKDQYDDLLNFLDAYHPAGVQVETRGVRAFVHGWRAPAGWRQLPTYQTFPPYRSDR